MLLSKEAFNDNVTLDLPYPPCRRKDHYRMKENVHYVPPSRKKEECQRQKIHTKGNYFTNYLLVNIQMYIVIFINLLY